MTCYFLSYALLSLTQSLLKVHEGVTNIVYDCSVQLDRINT
ncbi:hypothetical protein SBF1_6660002 [Candidatus Desulfosporosinus infrequens]|uniref:Uncharacterized protein n=1 Tax=Candidatus Desulfosporosinus infrequens TaxID=2043169 RepID=A0A2U3LNH6_9FIRM|nr:hypothetical protein SBF1_6660002 [Candidatus Desulfosporosinus infrequens]